MGKKNTAANGTICGGLFRMELNPVLSGQLALCQFDQLCECSLIIDSQFRQHLAVNLDVGQLQADMKVE